MTGIELSGRTLGLIGFGAIGQRVAPAAHFGLGMRVLAVDSRPRADLERLLDKPFDRIAAEIKKYRQGKQYYLIESKVLIYTVIH